jgi:hypothetical protein
MGATNLNIDANSLGARITIALVVLGLMVEVLSDNFDWKPQAEPMAISDCIDLCWGQGQDVERVEAWACQCRASVQP